MQFLLAVSAFTLPLISVAAGGGGGGGGSAAADLAGEGTSFRVKRLPHILFVIVDDLGWAGVGYHREEDQDPLAARTPHIDALAKVGVRLKRHYVHSKCTPSRASFQSGRLPAHVLLDLAGRCDYNGAIPRNMTGIAEVLKRAGYATHLVGKWDCGMSTPKHTPKGRGYDTSLNFFGHGNWMWTEKDWLGSTVNETEVPSTQTNSLRQSIVDLWDTDAPARNLNGTDYEELIYRDRIVQILKAHDQSKALFLQYNTRLVHYPLQVPLGYQNRFDSIELANRKMYNAMVSFLDDQLANITTTMEELGMWNHTLMVFTSDNGGYVMPPNGKCISASLLHQGSSENDASSATIDLGHGLMCFNGEAGANNWPLRGGKYSLFEGGIRVPAFVSGGFLPAKARGRILDGIMHIADWYRTLTEGIAGQDPTDHEAAASDLPPIDSLNMWPMLTGQSASSPRDTLLIDGTTLLWGEWKYVRGDFQMRRSGLGSKVYPNESTQLDPVSARAITCPPQGCLFNVVHDMSEHHEVSESNPGLTDFLKGELHRQAKTIWRTEHFEVPTCKRMAVGHWGGFYGPFREVEGMSEEDQEKLMMEVEQRTKRGSKEDSEEADAEAEEEELRKEVEKREKRRKEEAKRKEEARKREEAIKKEEARKKEAQQQEKRKKEEQSTKAAEVQLQQEAEKREMKKKEEESKMAEEVELQKEADKHERRKKEEESKKAEEVELQKEAENRKSISQKEEESMKAAEKPEQKRKEEESKKEAQAEEEGHLLPPCCANCSAAASKTCLNKTRNVTCNKGCEEDVENQTSVTLPQVEALHIPETSSKNRVKEADVGFLRLTKASSGGAAAGIAGLLTFAVVAMVVTIVRRFSAAGQPGEDGVEQLAPAGYSSVSTEVAVE